MLIGYSFLSKAAGVQPKDSALNHTVTSMMAWHRFLCYGSQADPIRPNTMKAEQDT